MAKCPALILVVLLCIFSSAHASGINAFCTAVENDDIDMVKLSLESNPELVNQMCAGGQAPLHFVVSVTMAEYLVSKGGDVNAKAFDGSTPLHEACLDGNVEVVRYFLQKNAAVDEKGPMKMTPVMMAAKKGSVETVKLLVMNGASIKSRDSMGRTVLEVAQVYGKKDVAELLKSLGADR